MLIFLESVNVCHGRAIKERALFFEPFTIEFNNPVSVLHKCWNNLVICITSLAFLEIYTK